MPRRRLMPDVVRQQELTVFPQTATVRTAVRRMAEKRIAAVLVTEGDTLKGIFTERDLAQRVVGVGRDPETTTLAEVMTADPDVLPPDALAYEALNLMQTHNYRHLPVVENGKVIGMVSIRDLFAVVKEQLEHDLKEREDFIFGRGYSVTSVA